MDDLTAQILDASLPHVAFDGWTDETFKAAIADAGVAPELAKSLLPRGALDLAVAFHKHGDAQI